MHCKRCNSERIVKNGKREGRQCYLCRSCLHQFVNERDRHTQEDVKMAVALYESGLPVTVIVKQLSIPRATVYRWVSKGQGE